MRGTERRWPYWLGRPWRLTFDYAGRSPRREYGLLIAQWFVIMIALGLAVSLGPEAQDMKKGAPWGPIFSTGVAVVILLLLPLTSAAVRRMHDHNLAGWMVLVLLIPAVGWVFFLILMATPGTQGENSFGPDPRDPNLSKREVQDIFG